MSLLLPSLRDLEIIRQNWNPKSFNLLLYQLKNVRFHTLMAPSFIPLNATKN